MFLSLLEVWQVHRMKMKLKFVLLFVVVLAVSASPVSSEDCER